MSLECAVKLTGVSKSYGSTRALDEVSLNVRPAELFAVVGPDGAGKTTVCNLLAGLTLADKGEIAITAAQVGYVTQHFSLYPELTVEENLKYAADSRGVPARIYNERSCQYLSLVGLDSFRKRLAGHLSGGMKQKLSLCCALIAAPPLIILDEPTTGLDPLCRRELWQLLGAIVKDGTTVFVATPQFEEADMCHRVALMHHGRVHAVGSPDELRAQVPLKRIEAITDRPLEVATIVERAGQCAAAAADGDRTGAFFDVQPFGDRVDILTADVESHLAVVRKALRDTDALRRVEEKPLTMENVFSVVTGGGMECRSYDKDRAAAAFYAAAGDFGCAIATTNLSKRFGNFSAVNDLTLQVRRGEIYGLLGANGAGKTTTVQMLAGLLPPDSGTISLNGARKRIRERIGYMSQKFTLCDDLTVRENLEFYARAYSLPRAARRQKIDWVFEFCNLPGRQNQLVRELPHGLRQKIAFCAATMHEPDVLFLDEPTAGIDPITRRQIWSVIADLAAKGATAMVTTHFLSDAEYCNRIGLMHAGQLVFEGTPTEIKREAHQQNSAEVFSLEQAFVNLLRINMGARQI